MPARKSDSRSRYVKNTNSKDKNDLYEICHDLKCFYPPVIKEVIDRNVMTDSIHDTIHQKYTKNVFGQYDLEVTIPCA